MKKNLVAIIDKLKKKAANFGASDLKIVNTAIIPIKDTIIEYCKNPLCASYGKSANCPPHAPKPVETRKLLKPFQNVAFRRWPVLQWKPSVSMFLS